MAGTDTASRNEFLSGLPWVVGAIAAMAVLSFVWWTLLEPKQDAGIEEIVIPEGTAAKIAAGEPTFGIPSSILIAQAGELRVINHDVVTHTIAGQDIPPGATADVKAPESEGTFVCSFHAGGSLGFQVTSRGGLLTTVAVPALVLGLPIGLGIALAASVGRRLNWTDEAHA